jgi:cytochrome c
MNLKRCASLVAAAAVTACFTVSGTSFAAGDVEAGGAVYKKQCVICHDTAPGKHKVGPSLHGVYGRKAGTAEGYNLYRGLRGADWDWDDQSLDAYLVDPPAFTKRRNGQPGSMVFKLGNRQNREDVIAYLKTLK